MKRTPSLIVSVHDVAPPHWDRVERILDQLSAIGLHRRSLLVIPNLDGQWPVNENAAFVEWLRARQRQGDEIVLHGYEHAGVDEPKHLRDRIKDRLYTQGEGEFLLFDYSEARRRIELGMSMLSNAAIHASGFIAPAWLINREGLTAAADLGFQYTNSYLTLLDLTTGKSWFAPSLVFGPGNLNEDLGIALQQLVSKFLKRSPIVRIVIHPPCVDNSSRFEKILSMVKAQLAHHQPATYSELVSALRGGN